MTDRFFNETPWDEDWNDEKYTDMQLRIKVQNTLKNIVIPVFSNLCLVTRMDKKTK